MLLASTAHAQGLVKHPDALMSHRDATALRARADARLKVSVADSLGWLDRVHAAQLEHRPVKPILDAAFRAGLGCNATLRGLALEAVLGGSEASGLADSTRVAKRKAVATYLRALPLDACADTLRWAIQLDALDAVFDTSRVDSLTRLVWTRQPTSRLAFARAKERFDDVSVIQDPKARLAKVSAFLAECPVPLFGREAERLRIATHLAANDTVACVAAANDYAARTSDPDGRLIAARYLSLSGARGVEGLVRIAPEMLRAVVARPDTDSIGAICLTLWSRAKGVGTGSPAYRDPHLTDAEYARVSANREANAWLWYGRALASAAGEDVARLDTSRWALECGRKRAHYGPEEEETTAPFDVSLGQVALRQKRFCDAESLGKWAWMAGDSRNYWAPQGESLMYATFFLCRPKRDPKHAVIWHSEIAQTRYHDGPQFSDYTDSAGLGGVKASRVAWGDFDGDGFDDLLLDGARLFRNDGGGHFTEVTQAVGLKPGSNGGLFADFDNDGHEDIYCTSGAKHGDRLWMQRRGRLVDLTDSLGSPTDDLPSEGLAIADANGDGRLDVYVANYEAGGLGAGTADRFWEQDCAGRFHDRTSASGFRFADDAVHAGRGCAWADADNDGWPDLYVSNYRLQPNGLFRNVGQLDSAHGARCTGAPTHPNPSRLKGARDLLPGRFEDDAPTLGLAGGWADGWWGHTIGSAWGDFDNNGTLDLFTANLAHPRYVDFSDKSALYVNPGTLAQPWTDVRAASGIKYDECHSQCVWGDFDNDGLLDLYITSIYPNRRSYLYRNRGQGRFEDVTALANCRTFNAWGCAVADFDHDGRLDLVVGSGDGVHLYHNVTDPVTAHTSGRSWLEVRLIGSRRADGSGASNRDAIGARITIPWEGHTLTREVHCGSASTSGDALTQHFGLSREDAVDVTVRWPSGRVTTYPHVPTNQRVTFEEP